MKDGVRYCVHVFVASDEAGVVCRMSALHSEEPASEEFIDNLMGKLTTAVNNHFGVADARPATDDEIEEKIQEEGAGAKA